MIYIHKKLDLVRKLAFICLKRGYFINIELE